MIPSLAQLISKCALENLDISDIDLGPSGCSNVLEETLVASRTLLHIDIRCALLNTIFFLYSCHYLSIIVKSLTTCLRQIQISRVSGLVALNFYKCVTNLTVVGF